MDNRPTQQKLFILFALAVDLMNAYYVLCIMYCGISYIVYHKLYCKKLNQQFKEKVIKHLIFNFCPTLIHNSYYLTTISLSNNSIF